MRREVAADDDLAQQFLVANRRPDAGARRLGVGRGADKTHLQIVVPRGVVPPQRGGLFGTAMRLENIHVAVVVEVRTDGGVALLTVRDARLLGLLGEGSVSRRHEQAAGIHVELVRREGLYPAVGVVDVEIRVVVEVGETRRPAPAAVVHAGGVGYVLEQAIVIVVEPVAQLEALIAGGVGPAPDGGDEPVEIAVVVVIAEGGSHAVAIHDDTAVGDVSEGTVGVVEIDHRGEEVPRDHQVGVAVCVDASEGGRKGVVVSRPAEGPDRLRLYDARRDARRQTYVGKPDHAICGVVSPQVFGIDTLAHNPGGSPMREKQVQVTVQIVVAEGGREGVPGEDRVDSRPPGYIGECAVAFIAKQEARVVLDPADEQVDVAVTVDIGERGATVAVVLVGGPGIGHAGSFADFFEHVVAEVPVQKVRADVAAQHEQIHQSVAVVVAARHAAAELFGFRSRRGAQIGMLVADARRHCRVAEADADGVWLGRGRRRSRWRRRRIAAAPATARHNQQ